MYYPLIVTGSLFFGSTIFSIISLVNNKHIIQIVVTHWKRLIIILAVAFLFKCPLNTSFFHGLEYEDAYVYKASARFFNYKKDFDVDPFLTTSCTTGSLNNYKSSATYSGHVIGYPYIIGLAYLIAGYHPNIANYLSLGFSVLAVVLLFIVTQLIANNKTLSTISCIVFICVPVFNVFSSTSLSEPTSSLYITLALLLYLAFVHCPNDARCYNRFNKLLSWAAILSTFLFMVLIKKENLSLAMSLPAATLLYLFMNRHNLDNLTKSNIKANLLTYLPVILLVIVFALYVVNFNKALSAEENEISNSPFSVKYFLDLMPLFMKSYFYYKWYFFFSVFLTVGFFCMTRTGLAIFPIIIFSSYFLLYTSHYRSYFYVKGGVVNEFETLRYMTNLMSIYSLIVGVGLFGIYTISKERIPKIKSLCQFKLFKYIFTFALLITCFFLTQRLRTNFVHDEYYTRIQPVVKTISHFQEVDNLIIITGESLLFYIYGDENINIIDYASISSDINETDLDRLIDENCVVYIRKEEEESSLWKERWKEQYDYLKSKRKVLLYDGEKENGVFRIYRIHNNTDT